MVGLLRVAAALVAVVVAYFGLTYVVWRYQSVACGDLTPGQHTALTEFIGQGKEIKSATQIETVDGTVIGAITGITGDGGGPTYRVYRCAGPDCEISVLESPFTPEEGKAGATAEQCLMGWMK